MLRSIPQSLNENGRVFFKAVIFNRSNRQTKNFDSSVSYQINHVSHHLSPRFFLSPRVILFCMCLIDDAATYYIQFLLKMRNTTPQSRCIDYSLSLIHI